MKYVYYAIFAMVLLETVFFIVKGIRGPSKNPWAGGNGCNGIRIKRYDTTCCTAHDHAYKQGGWIGARFDADADLLACVWKQDKLGKLAGPYMFLGARYGSFAFQYGKHRDIPIEVIKAEEN